MLTSASLHKVYKVRSFLQPQLPLLLLCKKKKLFTDSFTNPLCYIFPVSVSLVFLSLGEVILIRAEENSTCGQSNSRADAARLLSNASAVNAINASPLPNALHHCLALSLAS